MAENYKKVYQCAGCYAVYDDVQAAIDCLEHCTPPDEVFECEFCETVYQSSANAKNCCAIEDENGNKFNVIPKFYLEQKGQQRLF